MNLRNALLLFIVTWTGVAAAQKFTSSPQPLRLGAAWYPEQWPEAQWDAALTLMEQAHMNVVRIGEFAWSTLEPSEGHYELDWMERAIALAAKHHIAVVIGTPTDAPPAWLTTKYPDTLGMNADGRLREHGNRRQFNYASPRYRRLCGLIVAQLARRFGHNPNVIGWQIGNEYSDESFDPATRTMFQQFLREKYKTLDNLNKQWATAYWSQTYSAWSQIPMENTGENPGLLLEHKHFVTATWRSFQRAQIDVLRPAILATQFITTNIGGLGWSDNWDHYAITADLDLASWDDYVGQGHLDAPKNAMLNDFVRGWKRKNFWVMETEPGSVNWAPVNNALSPGETRALAWQTIGHGADAILYWQWRNALNGQEQYHGAIVGPDGKPLPIYAEIAQLGRDLELTRDALAGTSPHADVAILHDYDSRWAINFQPHTREYDQEQVLLRFYTPLQRILHPSGDAVDIIDPTQDMPLAQYKLLVAPSLNVLSADLAAKLLAYVQQGGHLLLGPRSGMKDEYNSLNPQRQPGPLAEALGGRVEQYYALDQPIKIVSGGYIHAVDAMADTWAEDLSTSSPDTVVQLRYDAGNGWLEGKPAMITRNIGKGSITYLGTLPDATLMRAIMARATSDAQLPLVYDSLPKDVELCVRKGSGRLVIILINHSAAATDVTLAGRYSSLLPESILTPTIIPTNVQATKLTLPTQGVAVLMQGPRMITRRHFLETSLQAAAIASAESFAYAAGDSVAPYRTPYKYPELILKGTDNKADFDGLSVDDPIVFRADGQFHMLYIGYDGIGYQTGLASSTDLIHWRRTALVGPRDVSSRFTKYNLALTSILRDKNLHGSGEAIKVNGRYLGAWNAYPSAGYEEGAAVIGLASSPDLIHWTLTDPILYPADGASWEHGGLYRPDLFLDGTPDNGTYYLYYNAKTDTLPKSEGGGWHEQSGVATSKDLKQWTRSPLNPILRNGVRGSATYPAANPLHDQSPPMPDARDSRFASNPYVVKNGSQYAMFYFGLGYERPGRACEMLALGTDPLHFAKVPEILINTGPPGTIDETFAHKPSVIYHDGALYHFYCAVSGKYPDEVRGIGVARSRPW